MAISLGAAILGSAGASAGGSLLSTIANAKFQSGENELDRKEAELLTRMQQSNALQQMRIQQNWEEKMANTQYQRLVKDLEAAGLNPASLAGTSLGSASMPHSGIAGASIGSGSHGSNRLGANLDLGSGAFNSAIAYMMRKDPQGAERFSKAIVNTAMQENREAKAVEKFNSKTVGDYMKEQGVSDFAKLDFSKIK